jgi:hypothetical protein
MIAVISLAARHYGLGVRPAIRYRYLVAME